MAEIQQSQFRGGQDNSRYGLLIYSANKVLLSHASNLKHYIPRKSPNFTISQDDQLWTINKGGSEENDNSPLEAALREQYEESGLNLKEQAPHLLNNVTKHSFEYTTGEDHVVYVFLIQDPEGELQKFQFIPNNSPLKQDEDGNMIYECDAFVWVPLERAHEMAMPRQKFMFHLPNFQRALRGEIVALHFPKI